MELFKLELPFQPISVNKAYATNWKTGRRFKSRDYGTFEALIGRYMAGCPILKESPIRVNVELYAPDWFNKNGTVKKKDASNYMKTLIDSVMPHLGIDDAWIFEESVKKCHGERRTILVISSLSV